MAALSLLQMQAYRNRVPAERRRAFTAFVVAVMVLAAILTVPALIRLPADLHNAAAGFWLLAVLAMLGDALPVRLPGKWNTAAIFPSICFTFAILINYGLGCAVVVQAGAVVISSWRLRHAVWRALFNMAQYATAFGLANLALNATSHEPPAIELVSLLGAVAAWFAAKYLTTSIAIWLRDGGSFWRIVIGALGAEALTTGSLLLLSPVAALQAFYAPERVLIMIVPLLAVRKLAIITEQQRHLANVDPLTGLPNRKALVGELASAISSHAQGAVRGDSGTKFALLLLDLDRFKNVNDALGHEVGDRLLIAVGDRLTDVVRPEDLVARLGGDEFAIVTRRLTGPAQAYDLASQIEAVLDAPVVLDGLPLDVGGSIGVAVYPDHGADFATLLRHADVAMYAAKQAGSAVALYAPEADQHSPQRLGLLADLRNALAQPDGGLALFYQPQVEISSGEVIGVEALLRWEHPTRGSVSPDELIRAAEPSSVMRQLTGWVLEKAMTQAATWADQGIKLRTSVNVSVRDLHSDDIVEQISELLLTTSVSPHRLQLEITESALMADPRRVLATLTKLHLLGVGIALDDFGTGYSSMQHLRRLPLSEVKIDRTFILGMGEDADDRAIVRSIIELAGALGLRVVAEGVEDERSWRLLHLAGCGAAQGWFYARPMPAAELTDWVRRAAPVCPPSLPASMPVTVGAPVRTGRPGRLAAEPGK